MTCLSQLQLLQFLHICVKQQFSKEDLQPVSYSSTSQTMAMTIRMTARTQMLMKTMSLRS